jgi:rod shape-determining protein MreC
VARPRRTRRTLTTVVVLVLLSVTIITLDQTGRTHGVTSGLKSAASDVFTPVGQGVDDVLRPIGNFFAGATHYGALQQENQKLQATVGRLRLRLAEHPAELRQLRQLQALTGQLHLPWLEGLPTVVAPTIAQQTTNFAATITLGKGRADGLAVGMPVVGAGGLVGQVVQAARHTAVVRLITDGQSKVGVVFGNDTLAQVNGQGPGDPLAAEFVPPGTPLVKGQLLVTNGLQGAEFPGNLPVGIIQSWHQVTGATQIDIAVRPLANLDQLAYVQVVQWLPTP